MASNLALRPALTAAAADLHAYILSILSDPGMTKCNPQRPQVSRGHCAKLQGWPGGLPRGRGAHQGGRGGRRGRQIAAGSKIRSGYFLTARQLSVLAPQQVPSGQKVAMQPLALCDEILQDFVT